MSEPTEREDLEQLVTSPGWLRFRQHVENEWGSDGCIRQIDKAISGVAVNDEAAARESVIQIRTIARVIRAIVEWPNTRAKMLTETERQRRTEYSQPLSRRGTL
jgi:hypothetical protein